MSVSALQHAIDNADTQSFLLSYFQALDEGQNLSIPTHMETNGIQKGWEKVFEVLGLTSTPEFTSALSQHWFKVISQQGGQINDNFVKDVLNILQGQPSQPSPSEDTETETPAQAAPITDVESQISDAYKTDQALRYATVEEDEATLKKNLNLALQHNHTALFLASYIKLNLLDRTTYPVPLSTVSSIIFDHFKEHIMRQFNQTQRQPFIQALTKQWFGLTNKYGIPKTDIIRHQFLTDLTPIATKQLDTISPIDKIKLTIRSWLS